LYLTFSRLAFARNVMYRANSVMSIVSAVLGLLIQVSIWSAMYIGKSSIEGITLENMLTYTMLTTFASAFASSRVGEEIAKRVRSGEIAGDFIRPISLKYSLIFSELGGSMYKFVFSVLPVFVAALFFIRIQLPTNPMLIVYFFISLALGFALINSMMYSLGLLVFWFKDSGYVRWFNKAFMLMFGGSAVPLWFYPEGLRTVATFLPWRFITYEPVAIYLGQTTNIWQTLLLQIMWILVFELLGEVIWKKAQKFVFVQGG